MPSTLTRSYFSQLSMAFAITAITFCTAWAQQPVLPLPPATVSTSPANGDVNPYGIVFASHLLVPGLTLQPNDLLISNFNNAENLQGTGTTIVRVRANGRPSLFFQAPSSNDGLTAALGVVRKGFVFVGNLQTFDGTAATIRPGALLMIDGNGNLLGTYSGNLIQGPWGMAIQDNGSSAHIFISNVLNGTITRLDVSFPTTGSVVINRAVQIGSGFNHRTDPAALVLGPSGLAYDPASDTLYVANSDDNAIYCLYGARAAKGNLGSGQLLYQDPTHLHGPTQMTFAPNGDLLVANSDGSNADPNQPSEIVEFTTAGQFVAQFSVDPNNGGAFGIAASKLGTVATRLATVDDNTATVTTWTEVIP